MAKFSIARVPYYIAVMVYMAFAAFAAYIGNTVSTGIQSDLYLLILVVAVVLGGLSAIYMLHAKAGGNDEADAEVAGLPVGKAYYYAGILAMTVFHGIEGYRLNHSTTGIASIYGTAWIISSAGIALFTWANFKSYRKAHPEAFTRSV